MEFEDENLKLKSMKKCDKKMWERALTTIDQFVSEKIISGP